jgi:PAT family beta-lactamase induction signal transducer AmpG
MSDQPALPSLSSQWRARAAMLRRMVTVVVLGFASGLPLALTGQSLQAWLTMEGVDVATIGALSLVGIPYTFKFLWAPLLDRIDWPWGGRRRGWLVCLQLLLAALLLAWSVVSPGESRVLFVCLAVAVAFTSASHDLVIDAYRTELLPAPERGLGSSFNVMGYRLAMILSGGIAFIWVDPALGLGWDWPGIYRFMAWVLLGCAVFSALALPRLGSFQAPASTVPLSQDVRGFAAVVLTVVVGAMATHYLLTPALERMLAPVWAMLGLEASLAAKWSDLLALLGGLGLTFPLAARVARLARFDSMLAGLNDYLAQPGAWAFMALIVLYKLTDAFALSLMTPFLLGAMQFGAAEVGVVNKVIGLWLTVFGALLGGVIMLRWGLWRSLMAFGLLQGLSNAAFWWLAWAGAGRLGVVELPAFDLWIVRLAQATPVDVSLLLAVAADNLSGGMGTAAFLALLMSLCNQRFTATQFALLSALASIGRVWVGPVAGVVALSVGWPVFFVLAALLCLPALGLLWRLRSQILALEGAVARP